MDEQQERQNPETALVTSVMTVANLIILAMSIKLYTEYFKDVRISRRTKKEE